MQRAVDKEGGAEGDLDIRLRGGERGTRGQGVQSALYLVAGGGGGGERDRSNSSERLPRPRPPPCPLLSMPSALLAPSTRVASILRACCFYFTRVSIKTNSPLKYPKP